MSTTVLSNNPTMPEHSQAFGPLEVTRLAPGDQRITADYSYWGEASVDLIATVSLLETGACDYQTRQPIGRKKLQIENLKNGVDYRLDIRAVEVSSGCTVAVAPTRLFRTGFVPGTVVNYIHPEDYTYNSSGRSCASPSLVRLPDGRLLACHDIYWGDGGQNLSKVFFSEDNGSTWGYLATLFPCFWGKLFVHNQELYCLGMSTEYGDLLLFHSRDWGAHWNQPVKILPGGTKDKGGLHQAPVPVVRWNGRIWTGIEWGSWTLGGHDAGVISASLDANLLDPNNWTVSPFLSYDTNWPGTIRGGRPSVLEGNVVITPEGELVNVLRYQTGGGSPNYGKAIVLGIDKNRPRAPLKFKQAIDFPGNLSKFTIRHDQVTKRYYALVNRVAGDCLSQRNILTLSSSSNLENWTIERDLINFHDIGWPEGHAQVGFQYVDWFFDGDSIAALSRTAINGAHDFHNANHLTFHRFANYDR